MNYKILGSTAAAFILKITLVILCFYVSSTSQAIAINLSVLIAGSALGWLITILATPYGSQEETRFATYKQTISAFVGGYLLSKIDASIAKVLSWESLSEPELGFRVAAFASGFLLSMLITYVYRTYA